MLLHGKPWTAVACSNQSTHKLKSRKLLATGVGMGCERDLRLSIYAGAVLHKAEGLPGVHGILMQKGHKSISEMCTHLASAQHSICQVQIGLSAAVACAQRQG